VISLKHIHFERIRKYLQCYFQGKLQGYSVFLQRMDGLIPEVRSRSYVTVSKLSVLVFDNHLATSVPCCSFGLDIVSRQATGVFKM